MGLNPLDRPHWAERTPYKKSLRPVSWSSGNTPQPLPERHERLSRFEIVARDAALSPQKIRVEVRGVKDAANGIYEMAYESGCKLSHYGRRLNLVKAFTDYTVRDISHLEHGRCRLSYILLEDSHMLVGPGEYSPLAKYQRRPASADVDRICDRMQGGKKIAEYQMTYGAVPSSPPPDEDELGVEML